MPINNIAQTISKIPPAGARGVDVQTVFVIKQEDFQDHLQGITVTELNTLKTQMNTMAEEMNTTVSQVNTNVNTATTKAGIATTKANEASVSATSAATSRNQAETFAQQAQASASSVDANNIVHKGTNITFNVGPGQTYTTINQALEYLSGFYPLYKTTGVTATINLKTGFVMAEQVLVRGLNLGWITIVGEDAETIITHTALTTVFYGGYPAFGVDKGGTSPVIDQLFRFNIEKVGGNKHGILIHGAGSSAYVLSNRGFIGAGVYGIYAATGSTINAQSANASNAGTYGIFAATGSTINAQSANASNAGTYGIIASNGSTINAQSANASNAGGIGIYALYGSTINAQSAIIQNQTSGIIRVSVQDGSHIEASLINTTGGTVPALSQAANTLTSNGIIYQ